MSADPGRRAGAWLVALQFLLLAALAGSALPHWNRAAVPALAIALATLALAVGLAAVKANRPGNFNIHPEPRAGGRLVEHGIYAWIRHPMYSALLLALAAIAVAPTLPTLVSAAALAAALWAKSSLEERWMAERHPGYAAYRARTKRFVPGLL